MQVAVGFTPWFTPRKRVQRRHFCCAREVTNGTEMCNSTADPGLDPETRQSRTDYSPLSCASRKT
jgi:hypothetical protein